jgi:hypothetical protein
MKDARWDNSLVTIATFVAVGLLELLPRTVGLAKHGVKLFVCDLSAPSKQNNKCCELVQAVA